MYNFIKELNSLRNKRASDFRPLDTEQMIPCGLLYQNTHLLDNLPIQVEKYSKIIFLKSWGEEHLKEAIWRKVFSSGTPDLAFKVKYTIGTQHDIFFVKAMQFLIAWELLQVLSRSNVTKKLSRKKQGRFQSSVILTIHTQWTVRGKEWGSC